MWQKIVDIGKQILSIIRKQQEHEKDIKDLRQEVKEVRQEMGLLRSDFVNLARVVEHLAFEIQKDRENAAQERRIQLLEIENRFLRSERQLPPAQSQEEND